MKGNFITPFKVGLVFLGSIVAFIVMYGIVNQSIDSGEGTYTVYATFDDATGLAPKSGVQLAGIRVGEVEAIELVGAEAKVTIRVQKQIQLRGGIKQPNSEVYKNGATLSKRQASLLGDYYLEVTPGLEGEVLKDQDKIHNVPKAAGLDKVFDKLNIITEDISKVTRSLAETFGSEEGRKALSDILTRLQEIANRLAGFLDNNSENLDNIVANAEVITQDVKAMTKDVRGDVKKILSDANAITREVRYIVGQSGADVQDGLGTLKNSLAQLEGTLGHLNYTLQNTGEITDKINEGEGTIGVLVNDPAIANETEKAIAGVGDFVNRIVELRTIVELRSEYLVRQSALKNYVALRLQPAEDKFYLIEIIDDPRGSSSVLQTTTASTDPGEPAVIREDQVVTTDAFKFSVMLAKRWGFATGRFGILESSGGVGLDLHFLKDDLEFRFDAFDFGEDVNPRLRSAVAYSFLQHLYIVAGADDILNDTTRDFFFGAQLRFNDEDLLTILSAAPPVQAN